MWHFECSPGWADTHVTNLEILSIQLVYHLCESPRSLLSSSSSNSYFYCGFWSVRHTRRGELQIWTLDRFEKVFYPFFPGSPLQIPHFEARFFEPFFPGSPFPHLNKSLFHLCFAGSLHFEKCIFRQAFWTSLLTSLRKKFLLLILNFTSDLTSLPVSHGIVQQISIFNHTDHIITF